MAPRAPAPSLVEAEIEAVLAKIDDSDPDGCWLWTGSIEENGYGRWWWRDDSLVDRPAKRRFRAIKAHRVVWLILRGDWPYQLEHRCGNRACVRPEHMSARTSSPVVEQEGATHCRNGHEMTPENTKWDSRWRGADAGKTYDLCRQCLRNRKRRMREAKRRAS